jgi:ABC-type glycerol-3-phosphate transport system substrate-binding protein
MLKRMKLFLSLFTIIVVIFSLSACSSSSSTAPSSKDNSNAQKITLRISWWGAQDRHDATLKALNLYTKLHPNIKFQPEFSAWGGYWDKLATESAAKNAPDIIQMDVQYLQEYAGRGQLEDLTGKVNVSGIDKALLGSGKGNTDNKLYAIALGNNAYSMDYNKVELQKLGMPLPQTGWTWDDLFNEATQIKAKLGANKWPMRDFSYDFGMYQVYQVSQGKGQTTKPDGKFAIDKTTWENWMKKFDEFRKEGLIPPASVSVGEKQNDPNQDLMLNGSILFSSRFTAEFPAYTSVHPNTYGITELPQGSQSGSYLKPSMQWSVNANSQYKKEAEKFIDWFINDPKAGEILGTTRGIPVSKPVLNTLQSKFDDTSKSELSVIKLVAPKAKSFNPGPQGMGAFINNDYNKIAQEYSFGKVTLDQAWNDLVKAFNDDTQK